MSERSSLAKASLRAMLSQNARRFGFTATAVDTLVEQSQITYWRAGQHVFAPDDVQDLSNFLVAGAVKVVCHGQNGKPIVAQLVRPGRFFGAAWFFDGPRRREFGAVAHADSVVALMSQDVVTAVLARLPPDRALHFMAHTWRILSRLLYEKCLLLTMPLESRLLQQIAVLARDFGRPHPCGVRVDLDVTHADLAELIAATRANVSRAMAELRRAGFVDVDGGQLLLVVRQVGARPGDGVGVLLDTE
jgi:CRP/FNR family transcriptional regulator